MAFEEKLMTQFRRWIGHSVSLFVFAVWSFFGTARADTPLDLLVAGHASGNVVAYDAAGNFRGWRYTGPSGSPGTVAGTPLGITVGPDGLIYMSTTYADHISRLDAATHTLIPFTTGGLWSVLMR
jgi:hypothetical protein